MLRLLAICFLVPVLLPGATIAPDLPPGGANAPTMSEPWELLGDQVELPVGAGAVRIPTGTHLVAGAAPTDPYATPGPVIAWRSPDGIWRGHGYLETWTPLRSFTAEHQRQEDGWTATVHYRFADDADYHVTLTAQDDVLLIDERSTLGVRDRWVLDCAYGWQANAAIVVDRTATRHASLTLPCHYDKLEASIRPGLLAADPLAPAGIAVLSTDPSRNCILGLWARDPASWANGDRLAVECWQRRQRPGEPASRHFLGPETKSDGTPNPHTAELIGTSQYEGHVCLEMALGSGSRRLGLAILPRPAEEAALLDLVRTIRDD